MIRITTLALILLTSSIYIQKIHKNRFYSFKSPGLEHYSKPERQFINALIFGKKYFNKEFKEKISYLQLHHLFTPSALHLSALLVLINWLPVTAKIIIEILLLMLLPATGLLAFKRAIGLKIICDLLKWLGVRLRSLNVFLMMYSLLFIFQPSTKLPSFSYSFLFLSIIFLLSKSSPIIIILGIWFSQTLIMSLSNDSINLLILPINSLLSALMGVFFPLFVLCFTLGEIKLFSSLQQITKILIERYCTLIDYMYLISKDYRAMVPTLLLILIISFFLFRNAPRTKHAVILSFAIPYSLF